MVGASISHYKIEEKLGEGGMGEVWKAEDTQLRRTVALKFLSSEAIGDEEIHARLIREAQASAALDHPNICHVYGIHEEKGETFIAMAFVDGPSLADKIKERPLPLEDALSLTSQIAEGLQEAHEKGIVHRDIKPHNVMLTAKGQVKIMDFGLAAVTGRSKLTKTGTTLGTPAYMAPEQLEGRDVDRRADIWALGCVLYEMLTQRTPFDADYEQAIAYGVLNEEPEPVTAQRSGVPVEIDRVIAKALAKVQEQRYQHVEDLVVDLNRLRARQTSDRSTLLRAAPAAAADGSSRVADQPKGWVPRKWERLAWAALLIGLLIALLVSHNSGPTSQVERPVSRWSFAPEALATTLRSVAVSPNGRHVAYVAGTSPAALWIRDIDRIDPRRLGGTEGATGEPFWSSDGHMLGFAAGQELKAASIDGGEPITICRLSGSYLGGSWSPDGETVAFSLDGTIYEVPSRGGAAELLFEPLKTEKGNRNYAPHFLPEQAASSSVVLPVGTSAATDIVLKNLETGESHVLAQGSHPVRTALQN